MNLPSILNGICDFSGYLDVEGKKMKEIHAAGAEKFNGADWTGPRRHCLRGNCSTSSICFDRAQIVRHRRAEQGRKEPQHQRDFSGVRAADYRPAKSGLLRDLDALLEHVESAIKNADATVDAEF